MPDLILVIVLCAAVPFLLSASLAGARLMRWAWAVPAGILGLAILLAVVVTMIDRHGQAGLAFAMVSSVVFIPAVVGGVLGVVAGWIFARLLGEREIRGTRQ